MPSADRPLPPAQVLEHARWMAALARHLAGGASAADDLVQDAWLSYLSRPPRDAGATRSWLLRVLRNFARRARRSHTRRQAREQSAARPEAQPSDPATLIERAEMLQRISELVLRLDEPYRSTVLLRYFEELPPPAIARREGVPVNTIYTRLRRALEELRAKLDEGHGGSRAAWLAVLAPIAAAPLAAPAAAAAASTSLPASTLGKLALGGIPVASKKVSLAAALSACLFLAVGGLFVWMRIPPAGAPGDAGALVAAAPRVPDPVSREAGARGARTAQPSDTASGAAALEPPALTPPALRGRVLDDRGRGLDDAEVIAVPVRQWEEEVAANLPRGLDSRSRVGNGDISDELRLALRKLRAAAAALPHTRSRAEGEFRFETLADADYRLLVRRSDFLPSAETIVLVSGSRPASADVVLAGAQAIEGRTVDEAGRPVAGVAVRGRASSWRRLSDHERRNELVAWLRDGRFLVETPEATSAADGRFELPSLAPETYDLAAEAAGMATAGLFDIPAGSSGQVLVLPGGWKVTGVVISPSAKPISGAEVVLEPRTPRLRAALAVGEPCDDLLAADILLEGEPKAHATTGERGQFEIPGVGGVLHTLVVKAQGFPRLSRDVDLRQGTDVGTLELEAGGVIGGMVVGPAGGPVSGARVWIEDVPREGVSEWGGRFYAPSALVEARTGADGRFRLDSLGGGAYTLHAASTDWAGRSLAGVRPGREDVRLELSEGFAIRGRVVDGESGAAVAGARIAASGGLWRVPLAEKTAASGPNGSFEIRGIPCSIDQMRLEATHASYPGEAAHAPVDSSGHAGEVVLRLRRTLPLAGRVVDADGKAVGLARVACTVPGTAASRADADGGFVLSLPPDAQRQEGFEVEASHPTAGQGRAAVEAPAGQSGWTDVTVVLQPGVDLVGKVMDPAGAPIARAIVRARRVATRGTAGYGAPATAYSEQDGVYRFPRLEPGDYRLEAQALGFARGAVTAAAEGGKVQDIVLEPGRRMSGRVVDQDRKPVSAAEVVAFEARDIDASSDFHTEPTRRQRRHESAGIAEARTDPAGVYELRDLPAGRLTLVARAPGRQPSELQIVEPDQSPADLVVTTFGSLSGAVVDAIAGRPLAPFTVELARQDGDGRGEMTLLPRDYDDPAGKFWFEDLPPGRYAVVVATPGRPVTGDWVDVRPGEEASIGFRIDEGTVITGLVKDADSGEPVASARVIARQAGAWEQYLNVTPCTAWSAADGGFRLEGISLGRVDLHVQHRDFASKQKSLTVEAGIESPPLEISLHRAGRLEGRIANLASRKSWSTWLRFHRLDAEVKEDQRQPIDTRKDEFSLEGLKPGRYEVHLHEEVLGPDVPPDASSFGRADMVERELELGEVEIRAGETSRLEATLPAVR